MSLRSPLRRVTGLGSAKGGANHWYVQRVTAVALVLLGFWFVAALASLGGASHANVVSWLASPISSALAVLLVVKFALVVAAVIGLLAVLRIAFGVPA